jgi:RNA polymerase sigma-70 factor (ECF subfamily)
VAVILLGRTGEQQAATDATSDDATLVRRILAGDREAYRGLVERESRTVIRACYRVLGDLHEAEDAAQEGFVTAYGALATWRAEGPFGAWVTRIAIRIALRTASRRRTVTWIDPSREIVPADGIGSPGHDGLVEDPAIHALRAERAAGVRAAVAALEEPYREVVALRFFGDLPLAEIAAQTGRPLGTVKTHLHRGLARLRSRLESEETP